MFKIAQQNQTTES